MGALECGFTADTSDGSLDAIDDEVIASRAGGAAAEGPTTPSKNVVFGILKNRRRRRVLEYLRETPETSISELAEHVAARENGKAVTALSSSERKRVYVGLYQSHLPKLAEADVIEYDRARGTVTLREATALYFRYLDIDPSDESKPVGPDCDSVDRDPGGVEGDRLSLHSRLSSLTDGLSTRLFTIIGLR